MPFKAPENPKCPKCGKSVYHAEARVVGDISFHKECYKCSMCNKMLDSTNSNLHENVLYCKTCHGRKFGPKGYGFGGGAAGLSMDTGSHLEKRNELAPYTPPKAKPGEGCPRCGGKVFAAEEMLAKGKSYHRTCFNCKNCRKPLDSVVHCDGPDKDVYCKVCYGKKFGPKGYGFGHGGGTLQCDPDASPIVRPHGNPDAIIPAHEGEIPCPRCGGRVFMAELMMAKGRPFHKKCFKCRQCKRPLDSMVHCDAPDGEIYCKLCYAKKYGPKGYGFAAGSGGVLVAENIPGGAGHMPGVNPASAAIDTTSIPAAPGEGCPRCGGKVFTAEERLSRGKKWHKRCYNCLDCTRPLDAMVFCDGPDGEIYCKLCYAKRFGPKGYGFAAGAGGVLVPENIAGEDEIFDPDAPPLSRAPAFTVLDVTKIPAREGQSRCPRCGGAVFQAESMPCRGKEWHKRCYNCCECHRPLDSMLSCDAPDGEIYCKLCYAKRHGPKGYGYGHVPALVSIGSEDGVPIPTDIRQFGFGAKGPKNWVPPIPNVNTPNQPHGPPPSAAPSFGGQVTQVGQQGSQQVTVQGGSQQTSMQQSSSQQVSSEQVSSSTKVISQSSSSSVQEIRTVTRVEHVQESRSSSVSSSGSSSVTQKVVQGGMVGQGEAVPIVAGIHMEEGEAVPIVAGVVPQGDTEGVADM